ncbi:hypothetical protein E4T49_02321 [Aureobasidium sp. EXF-10728]|nr:hypothetical protein E4T49_02321 [Aureobasidium sp. EXF-10728]
MWHPLLFLLACRLVAAFPLHLPVSITQQPLLSSGRYRAAQPSTQHLERVSRSAELLLTTSDDDEMVHIWLPLGKRVYTRDYPVLPLHPASARIINVLDSSTRTSVRRNKQQQQITCVIKAVADRSRHPGQTELDVTFQEGDGGVRLDEGGSPLCLERREVESYECF